MSDRTGRTAIYELETAARLSRLPPARVRRYIRVGLVRPSRVEGRKAFFSEAELARLRMIRRLGEDLGLNAAGVEVALRLVDEIRTLRVALDSRADRPHQQEVPPWR